MVNQVYARRDEVEHRSVDEEKDDDFGVFRGLINGSPYALCLWVAIIYLGYIVYEYFPSLPFDF